MEVLGLTSGSYSFHDATYAMQVNGTQKSQLDEHTIMTNPLIT